MRAHCGRGHNQQRSLLLLLRCLCCLACQQIIAWQHIRSRMRGLMSYSCGNPSAPCGTPSPSNCLTHMPHPSTHTHVSRGSTLRLNKPAQICIDIESKTKGEGQVGKGEEGEGIGGERGVRSRCKKRRCREKGKGRSGARRGARKGN